MDHEIKRCILDYHFHIGGGVSQVKWYVYILFMKNIFIYAQKLNLPFITQMVEVARNLTVK